MALGPVRDMHFDGIWIKIWMELFESLQDVVRLICFLEIFSVSDVSVSDQAAKCYQFAHHP